MPKAVTNPEAENAAIKQVAALALVGTSAAKIATAMSLSVKQVRSIQSKPEYKELMQNLGDEAVAHAKSLIKARTEGLAPEVWEAITKLVRSDRGKDMSEGIKHYFRAIGMDETEDKAQGPLIINMPGVKQEKVIEVQSQEDDDVEV